MHPSPIGTSPHLPSLPTSLSEIGSCRPLPFAPPPPPLSSSIPPPPIPCQVNLEYLARVVCEHEGVLYPDSVVGTDSHTTMIDGLGVAGWGVGGIEAEAAMLGQVRGEGVEGK